MRVMVILRRFHSPKVFSSGEMLLEYYQRIYPEAKHLRLKRWEYHREKRFTLLNYNTPMLPFDHDIYEIEMNAFLKENDDEKHS